MQCLHAAWKRPLTPRSHRVRLNKLFLYLLLITYYLLLNIIHLLNPIYLGRGITNYLLLVTYYSLLITYYLLLITCEG